MASDQQSITAGTVVCGVYRIIRRLGGSGASEVHEAVHVNDGNRVAVKVVRLGPGGGSDWGAKEIFERSSRVLSSLSHAGLAKLHAFQQDDLGGFYLVRELFEGGTLQDRMESGRKLNGAEVRALLISLLETLAYVHSVLPPVLHRDIKPSNIAFRSAGSRDPVLIDFDTLATPPSLQGGLDMMASTSYAAPEQAAGEPQPASDLYSLGVTLLAAINRTHIDLLPRSGTRFDVGPLVSGFDADVRTALIRLVEFKVADRYSRAREALDALGVKSEAAAGAAAAAAQRPPVQATAAVKSAGISLLALMGATSLLGVGVAAFLVARQGSSSEEGTAPAPPSVVQPADAAALWDGTTTLRCIGTQRISLHSRAVRLAPGVQTGIHASGHCQLTLLDVQISGGPVALWATGNASVTMIAGSLSGNRVALSVGGQARVQLTGTTVRSAATAIDARLQGHVNGTGSTIEGRISGDPARFSGLDTGTAPPITPVGRSARPRPRPPGMTGAACGGVVDCYRKNEAWGQLGGRLRVQVGADGRARSARYENGTAPPRVRVCLVQLGRGKKIEPPPGRPGELICDYAGQVVPGTVVLNQSGSFK